MAAATASPEARVLFLCAGGRRTDSALHDLLSTTPIDWESLFRLAAKERALATLRKRVLGVGHPLPIEMRARIDRAVMEAELRSKALGDRLGELLGALEMVGVEGLLLKGAGLAYTAYARPGDRPMGDIDLLVRPSDAIAARDAAVAHGWRTRTDVPVEARYVAHQHLAPLRDQLGVGLEIHTELFAHESPIRLGADEVWARARRVVIRGYPAWVPDPHHQMLHACLHLAWSHEMRFGGWRTLMDIGVLSDGDIDWDRFATMARASRGATGAYWPLRIAREYAMSDVPESVLDALRPEHAPDFVIDLVLRHFALSLLRSDGACPSVALSRALWRIAIQPRASGHGNVLPWNVSVEGSAGDGDVGGGDPARILRLRRYVGSVLFPRTSVRRLTEPFHS